MCDDILGERLSYSLDLHQLEHIRCVDVDAQRAAGRSPRIVSSRPAPTCIILKQKLQPAATLRAVQRCRTSATPLDAHLWPKLVELRRTDTGHERQVFDLLEAAYLPAVFDDVVRRLPVDRRQSHQLLFCGGVDVKQLACYAVLHLVVVAEVEDGTEVTAFAAML